MITGSTLNENDFDLSLYVINCLSYDLSCIWSPKFHYSDAYTEMQLSFWFLKTETVSSHNFVIVDTEVLNLVFGFMLYSACILYDFLIDLILYQLISLLTV